MKAIKVAIVEDNLQDLELLIQYLNRYAQENELTFHILTYNRGEIFLQDNKTAFDIVFMDMHLGGMDGLETSRKFRKSNFSALLIFITNIERYAIHGYEVNAMDFILKPIVYVSFKIKIAKVIARLTLEEATIPITIKQKVGTVYLPMRNIYYVDINEHNIHYHTIDGIINANGSLKKIEAMLMDNGFARCSSWCLVNLKYVEGLYDSEIKITTREMLHVSRGKRKSFLEALSRYYSEGK